MTSPEQMRSADQSAGDVFLSNAISGGFKGVAKSPAAKEGFSLGSKNVKDFYGHATDYVLSPVRLMNSIGKL